MYLIQSSTFLIYFPLATTAVIMSCEYATFNIKQYHYQRLEQMLTNNKFMSDKTVYKLFPNQIRKEWENFNKLRKLGIPTDQEESSEDDLLPIMNRK